MCVRVVKLEMRDNVLERVRIIDSLVRHDTIREAILTCAQKLTKVSLIYRTETKTRKWKNEEVKSKNGYAQKYR